VSALEVKVSPQDADEARERARNAKFTSQFLEVQMKKPMGLVLEENHPSIKVPFVCPFPLSPCSWGTGRGA